MSVLKIHTGLYLDASPGKGRGVYTNSDINPMTVIEISSVLVLSPEERAKVEQTALYDYIFEWGEEKNHCCVAWGYISMYNHSYEANCEYEMDYQEQIITVKTVRAVTKGEELTINYNGDWNDATEIWFETQ